MPASSITPPLWLAPLRGVTIRAFRASFSTALREAGFVGAVAPFIPANPGLRITGKLMADLSPCATDVDIPLVPQIITRHMEAMRTLLRAFLDAGFKRVDLNAGCPFPMVMRRGRGAGLFRTPDVLERLLEVGCEEMGEGRFSLKVRLGIERTDELLSLMPRINKYPLAMLTIHARTARQMYSGSCDRDAFATVRSASTNPVTYNGDVELPPVALPPCDAAMIGRGFVRALGARPDAATMLARYIEMSAKELHGDWPVLGRIKELLTYWQCHESWRRIWPSAKICRTLDEMQQVLRPMMKA